MKKTHLLLPFFIFLSLAVFAQIPAGYYDAAIGKKQAELKTALHLIIMKATPPGYGSGASSTWGAFPKTDVRPEDGTVWDMYTSNHVAFNGTSAASGMNIEHSLANSWWGGTTGQTYNDLFNLNPSNSSANSSKGSWPIAVVDGTTTYSNGVIKVGKSSSRPGGIIDAWEPADEYKGDFARSYMYMVTSYEDFSSKWTGNSVNQLDNNTYPVFEQWTVDLFLKWCAQDPVSQKEIDRNNAVYKIQGNRNPYIDYPLMAEYVWGKLTAVPFSPDGNVTFPYLNSPSGGATLDFGKVVYQHTDTASVFIKASNLTGDLSLAFSGTDASRFSVNLPVLSKADAEAGFKLIITYSAENVGAQTAQLTISGGGITATSINLKATSSDEFLALPASNISANSFTANWSVSAGATGYMLNVYSLLSNGGTLSKTLLEEDFLSGLPTAWTASGYTDNTLASNIRLASGSNTGKISLPPLNLSSTGSVLTVRAKQYSNDTGAQLTATIDNLPLAVWTTAVGNQDFTVNIPQSSSASVIALSAASGSRVYVDYVKVQTQGAVLTPVSVSGYPVSVGNVLNYTVTNLQSDSTYYYSVTPQGNITSISVSMKVHTLLNTAINRNHTSNLIWNSLSDGVLVHNLSAGSTILVIDKMGRAIQSLKTNNTELKITLPQKGIYLLQIRKNDNYYSFKIIY